MSFSAQLLINRLVMAMQTFPDKRTGKNQRYTLVDVGLGAFSAFFTQFPSFLSHQQTMQESTGKNNAESLFAIKTIPSDTHIREMLDDVSPSCVFPVFAWCFDKLIETKGLEQFRSDLGYLLLLDGTGYFSSDTIHCNNCSTKTDKKGKVTYSHSAITPVLAKPGSEYVLSLIPEYITPQDGQEKQDCETTAAKRFISGHGKEYATALGEVTLLGDDLYCHQPFIEKAKQEGFRFIFVCKPESHVFLYDWLSGIPEGEKEYEIKIIKKRIFKGGYHETVTCRYINSVPLKDGKDAISVNWCEMKVGNEKTGKVTYTNAWVTNHTITNENVFTVCISGRTRWKIENENNNILKTKGYHFEHNYGHGEKYLSSLLVSLILLAFLFHTLLDLFSEPYKQLRAKLHSRETFFQHIRALTMYLYFSNWEHLFSFMKHGMNNPFPAILWSG